MSKNTIGKALNILFYVTIPGCNKNVNPNMIFLLHLRIDYMIKTVTPFRNISFKSKCK